MLDTFNLYLLGVFLVIFLFYNQNLQYGFSDFYCKKLTNKQCTPNPLGNNCWMSEEYTSIYIPWSLIHTRVDIWWV